MFRVIMLSILAMVATSCPALSLGGSSGVSIGGPSIPLAPSNMSASKQAEFYKAMADIAKREKREKEEKSRQAVYASRRSSAVARSQGEAKPVEQKFNGLREMCSWLREYDPSFAAECEKHPRHGNRNPMKTEWKPISDEIAKEALRNFDAEYARTGDSQAALRYSQDKNHASVEQLDSWVRAEILWIEEYRKRWSEAHADLIAEKDAARQKAKETAERIRLAEENARKTEATRKAIAELEGGLAKYKKQHGADKTPAKLEDLYWVCGNLMPSVEDGWGRHFYYESAGGDYAIQSAGPDGKFQTDDDVTVIRQR